MSEDVGSRVVRVGLASREQLAEALSLSQRTGMPLVEALVCMGVDEESIAGLFAAEGLAVALPGGALDRAGRADVPGFDGTMALAFLALPLRVLADRLEVAMADPTDAHAVAELRRRAASEIVPFVARVTPLRDAILARFPEARVAVTSADPIAIEPRSLLESASSSLPSVRWLSETVSAPRVAFGFAPLPEPAPRSRDRWDDLDARSPTVPRAARAASRRTDPERATKLPEVASIVAGIRAAGSRDAALGLACEGAVAIARSAIFFGARRGALRGQIARGPHLDDTKAKLVEVPADVDSVLRQPLDEGRSYFGPFGTGVVDQMLRASLGSRGGPVAVHPVLIDSRCVGLLVADEVRHGARGDERIAMLAHALGGALRRILAETRAP